MLNYCIDPNSSAEVLKIATITFIGYDDYQLPGIYILVNVL